MQNYWDFLSKNYDNDDDNDDVDTVIGNDYDVKSKNDDTILKTFFLVETRFLNSFWLGTRLKSCFTTSGFKSCGIEYNGCA